MSIAHNQSRGDAVCDAAEARRRLHSALDVVLDAVHALQVTSAAPESDALVPIAPEPLAALDLEYLPVLGHAQAGTLRTVWIGRRRYTRRSWLTALADVLPAAAESAPPREEDDLTRALRKRAERIAAKRTAGGAK